MSKRTTLVVFGLVVLALVTSSTARAQDGDSDVYSREGFYLTLSGVSGIAAFPDLEEPSDSVADLYSWGFNGRFGYRVMPYLSVEGMFEWVDGWELEDGGKTSRLVDDPTSGWLNAKGFLPLGRWQPYLSLGVGAIRYREYTYYIDGTPSDRVRKATVVGLRPGIGLDYYLYHTVGLNVDVAWVQPFGQWQDYSYAAVTWGFFLRF